MAVNRKLCGGKKLASKGIRFIQYQIIRALARTDIEYVRLNNLLGDFTIGNLLRSMKDYSSSHDNPILEVVSRENHNNDV